MAQKIQTLYIDDLDGGKAEGTVRFGLDGVTYEIDLSAAHAKALRKAVEKYIQAGRKVQPRPGDQAVPIVVGLPMVLRTPQMFASGPRARASRLRTAAGYPVNWSLSFRRRLEDSPGRPRLWAGEVYASITCRDSS